MRPRIILCSLLPVLLLVACGDETAVPREEPQPVAVRSIGPGIDEDYARLRSAQVRDVAYTLSIDLTADDIFAGTVQIDFELLHNYIPLTIDFDGGEVSTLEVNGEAVAYGYNDWFISIAADDLVPGANRVTIEFSHPYSRSGSGLYRFTDPEDERVYLYTDFEPYDANKLFPGFDQPDIKASYTLDVIAPAGWQVISAVREREVVDNGATSHWYFPESARFSTYIFSLHAGEYATWQGQAGDIPLRLFARQSLGGYVNAGDWFRYTSDGLAFYQDYFGIPYPFIKYDQVIVPDFNAGAMENVAAVTFTESLIRRGEYTGRDRDRINSIILHEMAHMWFGDLVTMRWWNGLWLNESFATYMSSLAEASDPANDRVWLRFFLGSKLSAYRADEQVTSHPIELPVDSSSSAFANFDGITYGKGASVLKQLSFLLGPENFRQGVGQYLRERAYANSELEDFTSALALAAGRDLETWTRQWLYEKGLNSLDFNYQCEDGGITGLHLSQSAPADAPVLREHRLQIALYNEGGLTGIETVTLTGDGIDVKAVDGRPCPDFVYPNHNDQAYIKVILPEKEFAHLATGINDFQAPLIRAMLWRNLWEAVRDARLPLSRYAGIVLDNLAGEANPNILTRVFDTVDNIYAYYYKFGETDAGKLNNFAGRYEQLAWQMIQQAGAGSDLQKYWYDSYARNVASAEGLDTLAGLLSGETRIDGLVLDQDRRWTLIKKLASHNVPGTDAMQQGELARDPSSNGRKAVLAAGAAVPDRETKLSLLAAIQDLDDPRSLADKRQIMRNLLQDHQAGANQHLLASVLPPLARLDRDAPPQFVSAYSRSLIEGNCNEASVALLEQAIADNPGVSLSVKKTLRIALQDDQRCINIKRMDTPGTN